MMDRNHQSDDDESSDEHYDEHGFAVFGESADDTDGYEEIIISNGLETWRVALDHFEDEDDGDDDYDGYWSPGATDLANCRMSMSQWRTSTGEFDQPEDPPEWDPVFIPASSIQARERLERGLSEADDREREASGDAL